MSDVKNAEETQEFVENPQKEEVLAENTASTEEQNQAVEEVEAVEEDKSSQLLSALKEGVLDKKPKSEKQLQELFLKAINKIDRDTWIPFPHNKETIGYPDLICLHSFLAENEDESDKDVKLRRCEASFFKIKSIDKNNEIQCKPEEIVALSTFLKQTTSVYLLALDSRTSRLLLINAIVLFYKDALINAKMAEPLKINIQNIKDSFMFELK